MRRQGLIFIIIGLIVSSLGGILTWTVIQQSRQGGAPAPQIVTKPVVVAVQNIGERTLIQAPQVALKQFPVELVPPTALTKVEETVGKISLATIFAGEMVLANKLAQTGDASVASLSIVPPGPGEPWMVIVAIPATDSLIQGGIIRPGDRVDIIGTLNIGEGQQTTRTTQTLLQNVRVHGIGGVTAAVGPVPGAAAATNVVTLLLSHQDAVALNHFIDSGGTIHLVLRSPLDTGDAGTQSATMPYIIDRFKLRR